MMRESNSPIVSLHHYPSLPSTNSKALELAESGAPHGTVVWADQQTLGRGQRGRFFCSPRGGLYASFILRPALYPEDFPLITLAAGLACCIKIRAVYGLQPRLKWPNDVYLGTGKVAGILTEAGGIGSGLVPYAVVGIGCNVNSVRSGFPQALHSRVASLYDVSGCRHSVEDLLHGFAGELALWMEKLSVDKSALVKAFRQVDMLREKELCYTPLSGKPLIGLGMGMDANGAYLVATDNGIIPVIAGDIFPR
jgi:BirA family biotin operon repressor/biotin-[acetyl-CoA-carboxylase] ligase